MAKKKALGDDPLFMNPASTEETIEAPELSQDETVDLSDIVSTEKLEAVKKTLSEMKHEVKNLRGERKITRTTIRE